MMMSMLLSAKSVQKMYLMNNRKVFLIANKIY